MPVSRESGSSDANFPTSERGAPSASPAYSSAKRMHFPIWPVPIRSCVTRATVARGWPCARTSSVSQRASIVSGVGMRPANAGIRNLYRRATQVAYDRPVKAHGLRKAVLFVALASCASEPTPAERGYACDDRIDFARPSAEALSRCLARPDVRAYLADLGGRVQAK